MSADVPNEPKRRKTVLRRRIRQGIQRPFKILARWLIPPLYCLYMKFAYLTSKVEHIDTDLLWALRERYGGLVGTMWHQEVFMVAWSFREYEGHTLASHSDLTYADQRRHAVWQINIDSAAKTDQAETFTREKPLPFLDPDHDAPRHQPRDLNDGNITAIGQHHSNRLPLVMLTCLVERSI